jgi:hypothetical protein
MTDLEWHENKKLRRMEVAAPKMLDALKAVEEWWLADGTHHFVGAPYAIFAVRAAIAEAEGEP